MPASERILWISPDKTVFVETFTNGDTLNVALREMPDHTWGPPKEVLPENATNPWRERRIVDLSVETVEVVTNYAEALHLTFSQALESLLMELRDRLKNSTATIRDQSQ